MTETLPDHVGLERLPVDLDKEPWVFRRPRRQYDIGDPFSVLLLAKVEPLLIEEDLPYKETSGFLNQLTVYVKILTSGVLKRSGMSSFTSVVDSLLARRHVFSKEWKDLSGRSKFPS